MYKSINIDILSSSDIINEGAHAYILRTPDGHVYKIYKGAFNNKGYNLDKEDTKKRLEYIVSHKDKIKKSKLPLKILEWNGYPIGVEIEYFENCITLEEYLTNNPNVDMDKLKEKLLSILNELIEHNIVPTDPHFGNWLVRENESGIEFLFVDIDDVDVLVFSSERDIAVFKNSSVLTCYWVLDECFKVINSGKKKI